MTPNETPAGRVCNEITDTGLIKSYVVDANFPVMKQMGSGPVIRYFSRKESDDLLCQCGNTLISNYVSSIIIAVAIECGRCGQLTLTPKLPHGEILPTGLGINVLPNRTIYLDSTMYLQINNVVTSSSTLLQDQSMFNPIRLPLERKSYRDLIADIEKLYDILTNGCLVKHLESVKRSQISNLNPNAEYPLPWALHYLRNWDTVSLEQMRLDRNFAVALYFLITFHDVVSRWRHHPVFEEFGRVFSGRKSFHHNISQLTAATILVQNGNRIGLAKALGDGVRTPDMYVNFAELGRFHIEVKAPEVLQWASNKRLDDVAIGKLIRRHLEKSQINSKNPGIVVIGCTKFSGIGRMNKICKDTLKTIGSLHRSVAGIYLIQGKNIEIKDKNDSGILPSNITTDNTMNVNLHYIGENPFRTN